MQRLGHVVLGHLNAVATHQGLGIVGRLLEDHEVFGRAHLLDEEVRQLVGTETHVLGIDSLVFKLCTHRVGATILRVMETARVDGLVDPLAVVIIGGNGLLAAAQLVALLLFLALDPLVVFHLTVNLGEVACYWEGAILEDVVRHGCAISVHHLAVKRGIHLVGMLHLYSCLLRLNDGVTGLDGAALVPPQQHGSGQEHQETRSNLFERVAHAGSIACGCCFCVSHK